MDYHIDEVDGIKEAIAEGCTLEGLQELQQLLEYNKWTIEEGIKEGLDFQIDLNTVNICLSLLEQAIKPVQ